MAHSLLSLKGHPTTKLVLSPSTSGIEDFVILPSRERALGPHSLQPGAADFLVAKPARLLPFWNSQSCVVDCVELGTPKSCRFPEKRSGHESLVRRKTREVTGSPSGWVWGHLSRELQLCFLPRGTSGTGRGQRTQESPVGGVPEGQVRRA